MQNQILCNVCRTTIFYLNGVTNVCCTICNSVTSVPPTGMEMARLICVGCRTLLMHTRGATRVRCFCCNTMNTFPAVAYTNCGNCQTWLMYHAITPSIQCPNCHFITHVRVIDRSPNQIVLVHNPETVDERGKLVSNVVVGFST